jgi:hypothetical protein
LHDALFGNKSPILSSSPIPRVTCWADYNSYEEAIEAVQETQNVMIEIGMLESSTGQGEDGVVNLDDDDDDDL